MTRRSRSSVAGAVVARLGALALIACVGLWSTPASALCLWNCSYTKTRYPIVLAHGMYGFDKLFGVIDYWYGIPSALKDGGAEVYVTQVSQLESSEERGEQLLAQVETIVALTGAGKVNLIGHSQGGFDVRYVEAVRPDLVASVTTIGSPHMGAVIADLIRQNVHPDSIGESFLAFFGDVGGELIALLSGADRPQDGVAAIGSLTRQGARSFAARYPRGLPTESCGQGPLFDGIYHFSWSGVGHLTNALDVSDSMLALAGLVDPMPNDGLVDKCSSHYGKVLRDDYFFNHMDEVNQVLGLTSWFEASPVSLLRSHANRLKNLGL